MINYIISDASAGQRLDIFIANNWPDLGRSFIRKLCDDNKIIVNASPVKAGYKLKLEDSVELDNDKFLHPQITKIKLKILYEDSDCLVIYKPVGLLTHSKGEFNPEPTVATFIKQYLNETDNSPRAGIVHRLDRATSGVIICAKNLNALAWLQKQFSTRKVKKTYIAIVEGQLRNDEAIIDMPIARSMQAPTTFKVDTLGKSAQTHYRVLKSSKHYSMLQLQPTTGRTHQIRVHLKYLGHPIVGDLFYNGAPADRLFLHALKLELTLPNRNYHSFQAILPQEFDEMMKADV